MPAVDPIGGCAIGGCAIRFNSFSDVMHAPVPRTVASQPWPGKVT